MSNAEAQHDGAGGGTHDQPLTMKDVVVGYLRHHDVTCARCGYSLRGMTTDRCPECGQQVELQAKTRFPNLWPLVLAVSPGLAAGILGLLFAIVIVIMLGERDQALMLLLPGLSCVLSIAIVKNAESFLRQPRLRQWGYAALIWLIHALPFIFIGLIA